PERSEGERGGVKQQLTRSPPPGSLRSPTSPHQVQVKRPTSLVGQGAAVFRLTPDEWTAVELSLRIAVVATVVSLPFGIAIAWLLARKDFWGKALLDGVVHLPLVLPPVVT